MSTNLLKKLRNLFLVILFFTLFLGCGDGATKGEGDVAEKVVDPDAIFELVILHTNDLHGHPVKFFNYPAPNQAGMPAISTFAKQTREEYENVLILDAGDVNTGRPESNFFDAEPDFIAMNHIGYDAMVLGNHEFDKPMDVLKKQKEWANFPFLTANVEGNGLEEITEPYILKEYGDLTVAILGLTTSETTITGNPEIVGDLTFKDEIEVAKELAPMLEKQADIVVALVHMGIYENEERGSKALAANVPEIDLIIDGHSHTKIDEPVYVNETPIVQAYQWGLTVGKANLTIQNRRITGFAWTPVTINNRDKEGVIGEEIPEDEELLAKLMPFVEKVEEVLSEEIGTATETFLNETEDGTRIVRHQETALGDLVSDSMLWYTKDVLEMEVDFAIQNGGGIRANLPEGTIKKSTIYEVLPFDNSVVTVDLKGEDVQKLFDYIATIDQGDGAFAQVSEGVSFTINYETKTAEDVLINGEPIDPAKKYKIATNSYLASGGDGYGIFDNAIDKYDTSMFQRDVFIDYVKEIGPEITPEVKERINQIGSSVAYLFNYLVLTALSV